MRTRCATGLRHSPLRPRSDGSHVTERAGDKGNRSPHLGANQIRPTRQRPTSGLLANGPPLVRLATNRGQPRGLASRAVALGELDLDRLAPARGPSELLAADRQLPRRDPGRVPGLRTPASPVGEGAVAQV